MNKKFYITTAIAYGNAAPHIGHALEFVMGDTIARYHKLMDEETYFVTGMDEHGQKIEEKAKEEGVTPQELVDRTASLFKDLDKELGVNYDYFVRTSDEAHKKGATVLWNKLLEKGDLEKRKYKALYCVGCEAFKTEKDLTEKGECPIHLTKPEVVEEENYFFKLSKYSDQIKEKIISDELKVYPESRKNEILALIDRGLEDVSFSRPKEKVSWGIPVPGDDSQVMYVWCDALSNYITAIGYGTPQFKSELWENATHLIGKDILRFHAAIWPGMLLSAGLPLPKNILVHGFITSGGQKMSKTVGNVINPKEIIDLFKTVVSEPELAGEALRFVLLHEVPTFEDGDLTTDSIKASYNSYLANGIGNLTNRIMKLASANNIAYKSNDKEQEISFFNIIQNERDFLNLFEQSLNNFDPKRALENMLISYNGLKILDERIQTEQPFKSIKEDPAKGIRQISDLLINLLVFAIRLQIFMPRTSEKILECIRENKMPEKPLFGRLA